MFKPNSLLLYKNQPARLLRVTDRIEVELENGEVHKVRPKDVALLHPGPITSLKELKNQPGEIEAAWEILAGAQTSLAELAELAFGVFTPSTAWAAWQQVAEGMLFEGQPDAIKARSVDEVAARRRERDQAAGERLAWQEFIARLKKNALLPQDSRYLKDVEALALGKASHSQALRALGRIETPENAHALLLEAGVWQAAVDPYPARMKVDFGPPDLPVPALAAEPRLDLRHLPAFAIDDAGTDTPDDAFSLDGSRLWVHIADAAALVPPGSPLDLEARGRGLTLHLPEGAQHLLPRAAIDMLGLGLQAESPALSFGIDLDPGGEVTGFMIAPSLVRVVRLTYEAAEAQLDEDPLRSLYQRLDAVRQRRLANGAVMIDFPEVKIHVTAGEVTLAPIHPLRSRALVEEAMILAGTQTARFAAQHGVCLPFSQQEAVESEERPTTLSGMYGLRRFMKRSRYRVEPGPHHGLGVEAYCQVTSPLRRYLDLVGHQQLRAWLAGRSLLPESEVLERIGAVDALMNSMRQAEILAEKHWTLVYLLQHPDWQGEGILVEKRGSSGTLLIPALGWETRVYLPREYELDQPLMLRLNGVNLAQRDAVFRIDPR